MHYQNHSHLAIERFHLEFLRLLASQLDPALYAVKGGGNLRLCLGSIRCSEDLDIDVHKVARETLAKKVTKLLEDRLPKLLLPTGFSLAQFSAPKQTDTVQRWKATLMVGASPVSTKIEFSRRGLSTGIVKTLISPEIAVTHQAAPFALSHYGIAAAVRQKVAALAGRPLTQARDIFDLHFLFSQGGRPFLWDVSAPVLSQAAENGLSISYHDFLGQVVAYLPPEHQASYKTESIWSQVQDTVIAALIKAHEEKS